MSAEVTHYRVANWERYQHYKSGRGEGPLPWIKLYRELANDEGWFELTDAQRGQLVGIWLLAAGTGGTFKANKRWVAHRIMCTESLDLEFFADAGWLVPMTSEDADEGASTDPSGRASTDPSDRASNTRDAGYQDASKTLEQAKVPENIDASNVLAGRYQGACLEESRVEESRGEESETRARVSAYPREGQPADQVVAELVKHGVPDTHLEPVAALMRSGEAGAARAPGVIEVPSDFRADALARRFGASIAALAVEDPEATRLWAEELAADPKLKARWWRAHKAEWPNIGVQKVRERLSREAKQRNGLRPAPPGGVNEWGEPLYDAAGSPAREF